MSKNHLYTTKSSQVQGGVGQQLAILFKKARVLLCRRCYDGERYPGAFGWPNLLLEQLLPKLFANKLDHVQVFNKPRTTGRVPFN